MNRTALACTSIATIGLLAAAALVTAGPLNPPAGPVAPTYKTLIEVEPRTAISAANTPGDANSLFRITQPGSYYLTGNVTGAPARHGIEIAADNVSLDLAGFALQGVPGSLHAIAADGQRRGLTIRTGSIRDWGAAGVNLGPTYSDTPAALQDLHVSGCGGDGISAGQQAVVRVCVLTANAGAGVRAGSRSVVTDCSASNNTGPGISVAGSGLVTGCAAGANGTAGIEVGPNSTVASCTSGANTGAGIAAERGCEVTGCTVSSNLAGGIIADSAARIAGCLVDGNIPLGVSVSYGSTVAECTVNGSSGDGIYASSSSTVEHCTVTGSREDAIEVGPNCVVRNNTCSLNGNGGVGASIRSESRCRIEGNTCFDSDLGIVVNGGRSHVEGNTCVGCDTIGFDINGTGHIVIRNTASGNLPNFSVEAGNSVAPRVGVVASDGWAGITNADHPWANFGY